MLDVVKVVVAVVGDLVPETLVALSGGELDGDAAKVHHLQHLLGLGINLNDVLFQSRNIRNVVVPPLSLLFLQLDGDTTDSAALQTLHQMGDETSNLIPERLG